MTLRGLRAAWDEFFFEPEPPLAIGLYRIFYGAIVCVDLWLLRPDWTSWYGERGVLPLSALAAASSETGVSLFQFLPAGDAAVQASFWVLLAAAVSLTAGFCTRASAVLVFTGLVSMHHRNPLPLDGGDTALRVLGFGLMFSHAGRAYSIDRP